MIENIGMLKSQKYVNKVAMVLTQPQIKQTTSYLIRYSIS